MEIIYGTLYILSHHKLAENVYGLIDRESVLSIITMGIIMAIASRNYNFKREGDTYNSNGGRSSMYTIPVKHKKLIRYDYLFGNDDMRYLMIVHGCVNEYKASRVCLNE